MQSLITNKITLEALDGNNYELIITNDTEYDLSGSFLYFNLYDEDGVLIDTVSTYFESWVSGSKNKASVFESKEFSSVEMMIEYYSNSSYSTLSTAFVPISYVNNMIIEIKMETSIPNEFTYSFYNRTLTKCIVTDFSYEVSGWNDGKAYVNITISGEKTYDVKGNSYSRGCLVGWKLYDSKGTVIDSGNFNTSNIAVNESFAETTSYINNLPVGVYTLELLNVG